MKPKSTERSRKSREKRKNDPQKHAEYLQKERERYKKRRESGQLKTVSEMTKKERNLKRRQWKVSKRNQRAKRKAVEATEKFVATNTPPESPELVLPGRPISPNVVDQSVQKRGRRKVKNRQTKAYRELANVNIKLKKALAKVEKYKKRCFRIKKQLNPVISPRRKASQQSRTSRGNIRKVLLFHNAVMEELKVSSKSLTRPKDKQIWSKLIAGQIIKKYRLGQYANQQFGYSLKMRRANQTRPRSLIYHRRTQSNAFTTSDDMAVAQFLERDDNSRATTGKRDTLTRKKQKMQKRLLCDTLQSLHSKFRADYPHIAISYSEFCKRKPFWIVSPTLRDRDTCLCKTCENAQFMADRLFQQGILWTSKVEVLVISMCCTLSKECMYRECITCFGTPLQVRPFEEESQVWWHQWKSKVEEREKTLRDGTTKKFMVHLTTKEKIYGTLRQLLDDFSTSLNTKMGQHVFNIKHQYATLRRLKDNLAANEVLLHVDFAENYTCKYGKEIQATYYGDSHQQVTLHTAVAYTKEGHFAYCTLSASYRHDPSAIWAHLRPVLHHLQEKYPATSVLHMVSDGPTTQYRSQKNFFLLSTEPFKMEFKMITWNFLEAGHGKGPADGVGAAVKRNADALVAKGIDIQSGAKMHEELLKLKSSVTLFNVTDQEIAEVDKVLREDLLTVKGTMKIHQVCTVSLWTVYHSIISYMHAVLFHMLPLFCLSYTFLDPHNCTWTNNLEGAELFLQPPRAMHLL